MIAKADVICVSHAHGDHVGDVPDIATRTGAKVVRVRSRRASEAKGVTTCCGMAWAARSVEGLAFTMVNAAPVELRQASRPNGGGEGRLRVITLEDGTVLYFAGDTGPTMDMHITRELYAPEIAFPPIGDHYTMGPREAAWATQTLGVKWVLPMHQGTPSACSRARRRRCARSSRSGSATRRWSIHAGSVGVVAPGRPNTRVSPG